MTPNNINYMHTFCSLPWSTHFSVPHNVQKPFSHPQFSFFFSSRSRQVSQRPSHTHNSYSHPLSGCGKRKNANFAVEWKSLYDGGFSLPPPSQGPRGQEDRPGFFAQLFRFVSKEQKRKNGVAEGVVLDSCSYVINCGNFRKFIPATSGRFGEEVFRLKCGGGTRVCGGSLTEVFLCQISRFYFFAKFFRKSLMSIKN